MTITLMPAGTTGDPSRDEDIIDRIAAVAAEVGVPVRWAAQVIVPKALEAEPDHKVPRSATPAGRVEAATKRATRLPQLDGLYINYEANTPNYMRARVTRAVAEQVMVQTGKPAEGMYATPRFNRMGHVGYPMGWAGEMYAGGLVKTACPRAYFDDDDQPDLSGVMEWCRVLKLDMRPYVSGQVAGDGELVKPEMLAHQAEYFREIGVGDNVIVWCNIATPQAVDGVRNVLTAIEQAHGGMGVV